jgi:hypothetical protein
MDNMCHPHIPDTDFRLTSFDLEVFKATLWSMNCKQKCAYEELG